MVMTVSTGIISPIKLSSQSYSASVQYIWFYTQRYTHLVHIYSAEKFYESVTLAQLSPTFLAPGTSFLEDSFSTDLGGWGDGFGMIQAHYTYCALYFYYYYIVIYNEIIIQLTRMQNQWEP